MMAEPATLKTDQYRNLASRLLLSRQWKNQHLIPLEQPLPLKMLVRAMSLSMMRGKIDDIQIKAPIFIIGTPRCGSTMLQEILSTHEDIAYFTHAMDVFADPRTFKAADWLRRTLRLDVRGERYLKDSVMVDGSSPSEAMRFWGECLKFEPFSLAPRRMRASDLQQQDIDRLYDGIKHVIDCFRESGGHRFLNKSPALLTEILLLQDLFPDARFVYLIRDGRMVANSLLKLYRLQREQDLKTKHPLFKDQAFVPYPRVAGLSEYAAQYGLEDVRTTAHVWDASVKFINDVRPQIRNFHEVRYEDVLASPRSEINRIFKFCGLPKIKRGKPKLDGLLAKVGVLHHKNSYGSFDVVESIAGDSLRQYGYLT